MLGLHPLKYPNTCLLSVFFMADSVLGPGGTAMGGIIPAVMGFIAQSGDGDHENKSVRKMSGGEEAEGEVNSGLEGGGRRKVVEAGKQILGDRKGTGHGERSSQT